MISAGRMRDRITIQRKDAARDAYGAEVITWTSVATVWAEAQPITGREYITLRAAQADVSVRFRLRYLSGITPAMRVVWDDAPYEIVSVIDVGARGSELELICRGDA